MFNRIDSEAQGRSVAGGEGGGGFVPGNLATYSCNRPARPSIQTNLHDVRGRKSPVQASALCRMSSCSTSKYTTPAPCVARDDFEISRLLPWYHSPLHGMPSEALSVTGASTVKPRN
jgi:hypothetical protein